MLFTSNVTKRLLKSLVFAWLAVASAYVSADETLLYPYVMVSSAPGEVAARAAEVKAALTAGGFEVVGSYSPFGNIGISKWNDAETFYLLQMFPSAILQAAPKESYMNSRCL